MLEKWVGHVEGEVDIKSCWLYLCSPTNKASTCSVSGKLVHASTQHWTNRRSYRENFNGLIANHDVMIMTTKCDQTYHIYLSISRSCE